MPTKSKTLRRLPLNTRRYYRLCDELQSILTRLKNFRPTIHDFELTARAEAARELHQASKTPLEIHAELKPHAIDKNSYFVCTADICPNGFKLVAIGSKECKACDFLKLIKKTQMPMFPEE